MILAIDVDYREDGANIAGVSFNNWEDENEANIFISKLADIEEYVPGEFYKRELPCIMKLLKEHNLSPDIIIVDGFVYLDKDNYPGLGMYLYNELNQTIPIIGVAKSFFKDIPKACEIYRGESKKPLYVTNAGIDLETAKKNILSMFGKFRNPNLLKKADQMCRL